MADQTNKRNPLGPTGETVRTNVKRLRGGMQYKELSDHLADLGRPIPPLGLRRIEDGERRVDADDLVALAIALGVTPDALLFPHLDIGEPVEITGGGSVAFPQLWFWAIGNGPLVETDQRGRREFLARTQPVSMAVQDVLAAAGEERADQVRQLMASIDSTVLVNRRLDPDWSGIDVSRSKADDDNEDGGRGDDSEL